MVTIQALFLHGFPEHSFSMETWVPAALAQQGFKAWAPNCAVMRNLQGQRCFSLWSRLLVEDVASIIQASGCKAVLIAHDWEQLSHGTLRSPIGYLLVT